MEFCKQVLKGFGQIMLQNNAITGALFLLGIAYCSLTMATAALLATVVATLFAKVSKFDNSNLSQGIYGFSAALVGVAMLLFLNNEWSTWLIIVASGVLAAIIQHLFFKVKLPVFTLPFILVTWLVIFLAGKFAPELLSSASSIVLNSSQFFEFPLLGFGQVIFQGSAVAGLLFFIGVFVNSPIAALYALAASTLAGIAALYLGMDAQSVAFGLLSFNAVLTAIVFAGPSKADGIWVLISVALTLAISMWMLSNQLIQLTFPFVAASMLGLLLQKTVNLVSGK